MGSCRLFVLLCVCWSSFVLGTHQLQSSQTQVLLQLSKQLEYPKQLEIWYNNGSREDICYQSSSWVNITCENNFVTEIRIVGDYQARAKSFYGYAIPGQTLSQNFSADSLVATLSRLTSLRVLSLVSVGIWGPIPDKIHRLSLLESLDLSWNFLYGSIPASISRIEKLQVLKLDGNFFNGTVPDWFNSLSSLTSVSLNNNFLAGSVPSSISKLATLNDISLSKNQISGKLPDFSILASLHYLDLSDNKLDSELPSLPKGLMVALLSNNSFSGGIPQQYSQLHQLQQLDLSFNSLQGTPPSALFSLPNLTLLNLTSNMLSGSLPMQLNCGNALGIIDISNNKLRGPLPSCLSAAKRVIKYSWNCLSIDLKHQHPEAYCTTEGHVDKKKGEEGRNIAILVGVIVGIFVILVLCALGLLVLCRRYCPRGTSELHLLHKSVHDNSVTSYPSEMLRTARYISEPVKSGTHGPPAYRLFSYDELKEATSNFEKSALLGDGLYGKIYKGRLQNGSQVAIRFLTVSKKYTMRNLKLRLDLLAKLRHPHLVCLLGHCIDDEEMVDSSDVKVYLVYEYVPYGNYHIQLSERSPGKLLKWSDRLSILTGVAKAVHFLHTGVIPGFYSNRLKSTNILLTEHQTPKLSDYGLSIVTDEKDKEATGGGPRSWEMKSLEDDVYSFGFILLESLVGHLIPSRKETFLQHEMASFGSEDGQRRILDPIVLSSSSQESLSVVISIMSKCISQDSSTRPSFEDVLWNLQYASQIQATADGEQRLGAGQGVRE